MKTPYVPAILLSSCFLLAAIIPVQTQWVVPHRALPANMPAAALKRGPLRPKGRGAAPNQLVIKLAPGAARESLARFHARTGARVISEIPQLRIQTLQLPMAATAAAYKRNTNILWAEP